jgi:hypothetical protein
MPDPNAPITCPRDAAAMTLEWYEGIEIDRCPRCGGVWLDKGELEVIQESRPDRPAPKDPRSGLSAADDMARQASLPPVDCPICSATMLRGEYGMTSRIIVDSCPKGHGYWLDRGELEALERFFEQERDAAKHEGGLLDMLRSLLR